jgi:hypothetical protein
LALLADLAPVLKLWLIWHLLIVTLLFVTSADFWLGWLNSGCGVLLWLLMHFGS